MVKCPCKDCNKRTLTCHYKDECEDWKKFREQIEQSKIAERAENDFIGARVDSLNKIRRKKNAKNRT